MKQHYFYIFMNAHTFPIHTFTHEALFALQLYNMFPRLLRWIQNRQKVLKNVEMTMQDNKDLIGHLKETLNPHVCRGFVDCFLIRKQKGEVRLFASHVVICSIKTDPYFILVSKCFFDQDSGDKETYFSEQNLIFSINNLFAAGTDTTAATLRWGLLLMAKYPHIQGKYHDCAPTNKEDSRKHQSYCMRNKNVFKNTTTRHRK